MFALNLPRAPWSGREGGFSLVEMMIAMAISSMVVIAIYTAFSMQQSNHLVQEQVAVLQQNERMAMDMMVLDLRLAGYDSLHAGGSGFTVATSTAMTITMDIMGADATGDGLDNDGDGQVDEAGEEKPDGAINSVGEIISYALYLDPADGIRKLGRRTPDPAALAAAVDQPVAENVAAVEFLYLLADGTVTLAPLDLAAIRGVYLTVLTALQAQDFANPLTYNPASVVKGVAGAVAWGPFNDNFRRRMLSRLVLCRNMGLN